MSSRVNLSLLVDHINGLPNNGHLDRNLKFKVIYSSSLTSTTTSTLPTLRQHIHESFFSFDVTTEELKEMVGESLHGKVQNAFREEVSIYAGLLHREASELPKDVLYVLLPFLYGDTLTKRMLSDIVAEVEDLLDKY